MRRLNAIKDSATIIITTDCKGEWRRAARPCADSETLRAIAVVGAIIDTERPKAWNRPSFLANTLVIHLCQRKAQGSAAAGPATSTRDSVKRYG